MLKRRTNQKTDPVTSDLYTKSMYNPSLETQSDSAEEEDDEGKDEDSFENVESKEDLQDEEHNADLVIVLLCTCINFSINVYVHVCFTD